MSYLTIKKYYTSLEQSKEIMNVLGGSFKCADMCYIIKRKDASQPWEEAAKDEKNVIPMFLPCETGNLSDYLLPAWTLGALLDLLPKSIIVNKHEAFREIFWDSISYGYTIPPKKDKCLMATWNICFGHQDMIKNAVSMIKWLKNNKIVKDFNEL